MQLSKQQEEGETTVLVPEATFLFHGSSSCGRVVADCHTSSPPLSFILRTSYRRTVCLVDALYNHLSSVLEDEDDKDENDGKISPTVVFAVAIPSGSSYLATSILAVHVGIVARRRRWALLPVDPCDPPERIRSLLLRSGVACVLVAEGGGGITGIVASGGADTPTVVNVRDALHRSCGRKGDREGNEDALWQDDVEPIDCAGDRMTSPSYIAFRRYQKWRASDEDRDGTMILHHLCATSGTTSSSPKITRSSISATYSYVRAKNNMHGINSSSVVLACSLPAFDPCLGDVLATFYAGGGLSVPPHHVLFGNRPNLEKGVNMDIVEWMSLCQVTHVLCTPTWWNGVVSPSLLATSFQKIRLHISVVAMGGEKIPIATLRMMEEVLPSTTVLATYGVTEACVYQTAGTVTAQDGDHVGQPMGGNQILIVRELENSTKAWKIDPLPNGERGEVLLHGSQVDAISGYLGDKKLTNEKFPSKCDTGNTRYYRTGDRGYVDTQGRIVVDGRINDEKRCIKINGIRLELGEVEDALTTANFPCSDTNDYNRGNETSCPCIVSCVARLVKSVDNISSGKGLLVAYLVPHPNLIAEIGLPLNFTSVLLGPSPLRTLLHLRSSKRLRAGTYPVAYVLLHRLPTGRTGKIDLDALPHPFCKSSSSSSLPHHPILQKKPLERSGTSGATLASVLKSILNLSLEHIEDDLSFYQLGGDSLAAARVVRALYAADRNVADSRHLGGKEGVLGGEVWDVKRLLGANTLREYARFLDTHGACSTIKQHDGDHETKLETISSDPLSITKPEEEQEENIKSPYEALRTAIIRRQRRVACALVPHIPPNSESNDAESSKARLGKISDRRVRRSTFSSTPLHLAASAAMPQVVKALLEQGWKCNIPDAGGSFPVLLACLGKGMGMMAGSKTPDINDKHDEVGNTMDMSGKYHNDEDFCRKACVSHLLSTNKFPLSLKDGNGQTLLHCAARTPHVELLRYILARWTEAGDRGALPIYDKRRGGRYDWHDRWFRTPVHWAVLNGNVTALKILLEGGCSANPPIPSKNRTTGVLLETPNQMVERLYRGGTQGVCTEVGQALVDLLHAHGAK